MSISENKNRISRFTSSQIHRLMTNGKEKGTLGKPALTYIKEKVYEHKMQRSVNTEVSTRPILWGKFLESRVHDLLGTKYEHVFDQTIKHKTIEIWAGSPDFIISTEKVVCDSKCPQPKAFCELIENCSLGLETFKEEHPDYYWQLISNAVITESDYIELIVYMPYLSELSEIKQSVEDADLEEPWKYRFITESLNAELPYLTDNCQFKNLNIFRFEAKEEDKELLKQRVLLAQELFKIQTNVTEKAKD